MPISWNCEMCDGWFETKKDENPTSCPYCEYGHLIPYNSITKTFSADCIECDGTIHQTGERKFVCDNCEKKYGFVEEKYKGAVSIPPIKTKE